MDYDRPVHRKLFRYKVDSAEKGMDDVTYNSLTHITTVNPNIHIRSNEEIRNRVEQFITNYNLLKGQQETE